MCCKEISIDGHLRSCVNLFMAPWLQPTCMSLYLCTLAVYKSPALLRGPSAFNSLYHLILTISTWQEGVVLGVKRAKRPIDIFQFLCKEKEGNHFWPYPSISVTNGITKTAKDKKNTGKRLSAQCASLNATTQITFRIVSKYTS